MKGTLLSMLRSEWALDPRWLDANITLVNRFLKGEGLPADAVAADRSEEAKLMYSPMYRVSPFTDVSKMPEGSTAYVEVVGPITKYGGYCSYGAEEYAELTAKLSAADNIKNIIYYIDSPGGQVFGTQLFADAIKESPKRTIAFICDGYAASAAYWIASACDEIYCSRATDEVGSIGVYTVIRDINAFMQSEGMPVYEVYAPQSTDKNGDVRELLKGNDKPMKANLSVIAAAFINAVSTNRAGKLKGDAWQKGGMFYAPDAKKLGLIDGIKSLADISAMLDADEQPAEDEADEELAPETIIVETDDDDDKEESDPNANHNNTTTTMFGSKNKFPLLAALIGIGAADLSQEQIDPVNAELHAAGIDPDVILASASEIQASADRIAELEAEVKTLGAKPGALFGAATTSQEKGDLGGDKTTAQLLDELPHNKAVDQFFGG